MIEVSSYLKKKIYTKNDIKMMKMIFSSIKNLFKNVLQSHSFFFFVFLNQFFFKYKVLQKI